MTDFWKTSISRVQPNEILVRGYPIEQLTRNCSFGDVVFLLLKGELPRAGEGKLIEAMLVATCEHSLASPSVDAVRFVASSGVPLQAAVAAGVTAIGDVHGGAIEPCARLLRDAVEKGQTAEQVFSELRLAKRRLPGFGHPIHTRDPRTAVLLAIGDELKLTGLHTKFARKLEEISPSFVDKSLPMNVDGAIAALLCDIGIDPALGKSIFIIGRAPGYVAHAHEQMTMEKPMKLPNHDEITYTGPGRRDV